MEIPWGALVTLSIWAVGMTVGGIIWATTITVTLDFMKKAMDELSKAHVLYATRIELAEKFSLMQLQLDKQWALIDGLQNSKK